MKTKEKATKKPKLVDLKTKHGVTISKKRANYLRCIPSEGHGEYKESKKNIPPYSLRAMFESEQIKPSPRITCTSGMMWVRTVHGDDQVARVSALELESGEKY